MPQPTPPSGDPDSVRINTISNPVGKSQINKGEIKFYGSYNSTALSVRGGRDEPHRKTIHPELDGGGKKMKEKKSRGKVFHGFFRCIYLVQLEVFVAYC